MSESVVVLDLATGVCQTPDGYRCNVYEDEQRRIVETVEPVFGWYEVRDGESVERFPSWTTFMRFIGITV
jgi:hypothetical protein